VIVLGRYFSALRRRGGRCNPDSPISGQSETARSCACSRPPTPFSSHKLWENDWRPRMERVQTAHSVDGDTATPMHRRSLTRRLRSPRSRTYYGPSVPSGHGFARESVRQS
jgi:hypothetical protein